MNIFEQAQQYIARQKHVLITGKTQPERHQFLVELSRIVSPQVIWFPSSMTTFDEYLQTVKTKKLYTAPSPANGTYNLNQIHDCHRDWMEINNSIFIIEEFQNMEESWRIALMNEFIENVEKNKTSATLLIISMEDANGLLSKLEVNSNEYKTSEQIISSNLEIVEI